MKLVYSLLVITPEFQTPLVDVYASKEQLRETFIDQHGAELVDHDPERIERLKALDLESLIKWAGIQGNFTIRIDAHEVTV